MKSSSFTLLVAVAVVVFFVAILMHGYVMVEWIVRSKKNTPPLDATKSLIVVSLVLYIAFLLLAGWAVIGKPKTRCKPKD